MLQYNMLVQPPYTRVLVSMLYSMLGLAEHTGSTAIC